MVKLTREDIMILDGNQQFQGDTHNSTCKKEVVRERVMNEGRE